MKQLTFTVTIIFEDKVTNDNEIKEVAENIALGLFHQADTGSGLAPEDSETFTREVKVEKDGNLLATKKIA